MTAPAAASLQPAKGQPQQTTGSEEQDKMVEALYWFREDRFHVHGVKKIGKGKCIKCFQSAESVTLGSQQKAFS